MDKGFSYEGLMDARIFLRTLADAKLCLEESAIERNRIEKLDDYYKKVVIGNKVV